MGRAGEGVLRIESTGTRAIGAGGMGEVYRATDTTLGRDVPLEVPPDDMARDPEHIEPSRRVVAHLIDGRRNT